MVKIPRCPLLPHDPPVEIPKQLGCAVPIGAKCLYTFNLHWTEGCHWKGGISGSERSIDVELDESGGFPELGVKINIPGCSHAPLETLQNMICEPYGVGTNWATSSPECCPQSDTPSEGLSVGVTTTPLPRSMPPKFPPPCPPMTPKDCCPRPGSGPRGGGAGSGQAGGGAISRGGGFFGRWWGTARGGRQQCCPPSGGGPGGGPPTCGGGGGSLRAHGCIAPPVFSSSPVRYASGEIALSVDDIAS